MVYMLMKEKKAFMLKFVGLFLSCFFVGVNVVAAAPSFRESQRFSRVFPGLYGSFSSFDKSAVDVGDFDRDGRVDFVYRKDFDLFTLRFGVGDGTFTAEQSVSMPTGGMRLGSVVAGDFVGSDGKLDLIGGADNKFRARVGDGGGGFTALAGDPPISFPFISGISLTVADMNGDGKLDLVQNSAFSGIEVGLGDGNGGFQILPGFAASDIGSLVVGDVTGEGRPDVVRANFDSGRSVSVFDGDGTGRLAAGRSIGVGSAPGGLALADVDRDGDLDCVVTQLEENAVLVLTNDGRGRFTRSVMLEVGENPEQVAVSDVDGDGLLDIVVGNAGEASLSVLTGKGDGTFQARQDISIHGIPRLLKVADFNNDHKPDLIIVNVGSAAPSLSVLLNTSPVVGSSPENPQPQPPVVQPKPSVVSECVVPKVTGLSLVAARKKLIAAGCTIGKITTKKRSARAVRQLKRKKFSLVVVSQSVKPGVKIAKTTPVALQRDFRKVKKAKNK